MTEQELIDSYTFFKTEVIKALKGRVRKSHIDYEELFSNGFTIFYEKYKKGKIKNFNNISGLIYTISYQEYRRINERNKKIGFTDKFLEPVDDTPDIIDTSYIKDFILALPKNYRVVLIEETYNGKDGKELAEFLDIPYDRVRKIKYKAMRSLKEKLKKYGRC